jgi:hypothetical protein
MSDEKLLLIVFSAVCITSAIFCFVDFMQDKWLEASFAFVTMIFSGWGVKVNME